MMVILIAGIGIKIYTKKKLNDMDGINTVFVAKENDGGTMVGYRDKP